MKRIILTLLAPVAFIFLAQAQSNYKSGYVIKASGDTIKGYINYKEWDRSPKVIAFKSNLANQTPQQFSPDMLRGFGVNGIEKYVSYIGQISMDKNILPDLPDHIDTSKTQDSVFLHVVYEGSPVSLFSQKDDVKQRFFIQEGSTTPTELKFYQYYYSDLSYRKVERFKNQLLALAVKYNASGPALEKIINKSEFTESNIEQALRLINKDNRHDNHSGIAGGRFFASLLLNQTTTEFTGDRNALLVGSKSSSYIPRVGMGYDLFLNKYTQKFYLKSELTFAYIKQDFAKSGIPDYITSHSAYQMSQFNITFTPQLIFNIYNAEQAKLFLGVGAGFNYSMYGGNKMTYTDYNLSYNNYYQLEKFWLNFPVQAGITIHKKIDVFALYTAASAYTKYVYFSIANTTYGLGVRYLLSVK